MSVADHESMELFEQPEIGSVSLSAVNNLPSPNFADQLLDVREREGGLIDCWVPTHLIDHEEVPVKELWARDIAVDMKRRADINGGNGQMQPISLAWIPGEPFLKIADGFHRDKALQINGETWVYATIKEMSWDELYDMRIFTARDHAHVRFSRVVQWVREVWEHSGFSEEQTTNGKFSVTQAFTLFRFDTDGSKLKLKPEVVEGAKAWIAKKEEQWGVAAMTMHGHLKVAEEVAPELVHSTREKRDGKSLTAPTQAILRIFSKELPYAFPLQKYIMQVAMAHNLKGPQVKSLCTELKFIEDPEEWQEIIDAIDWDNWEPQFSETKARALRRAHDPRYKGALVLADSAKKIELVIERIEISIRRGETVSPEMGLKLRETLRASQRLEERISFLGKRIIEASNHTVQTASQIRRAEFEKAQNAKIDLNLPPKKEFSTQELSPTKRIVIEATTVPTTTNEGSLAPAVLKTDTAEKLPRPPQPAPADVTFEQDLREYLNGFERGDQPPVIPRKFAGRAERLLQNSFSGDFGRQEVVRELIREARDPLENN